jgi:hypothetical protein
VGKVRKMDVRPDGVSGTRLEVEWGQKSTVSRLCIYHELLYSFTTLTCTDHSVAVFSAGPSSRKGLQISSVRCSDGGQAPRYARSGVSVDVK